MEFEIGVVLANKLQIRLALGLNRRKLVLFKILDFIN